MSIHTLFSRELAAVVGCALLGLGCTAEAPPEPKGWTHPHLEGSAGVCGADNQQVLASAPVNLCTEGAASAVSGSATGPWDWTCGTTPCSALSTNIYVENAARDQRGALLRTVYGDIFGFGMPDSVYYYWVDRYAPPAIGCRATVQAFLLASPARAAAEAATLQTDPALRDYIHLLYRALLPGYPGDNTSLIAGWRQSKFVTMDQLDAIFLDNDILKNRCAAAGMEF